MQPSFDKLSYRNNTADAIKRGRIATEGCSQGWIHSGDTPAKSTDLAVAPVAGADRCQGLLMGMELWLLAWANSPYLNHDGKNVPAHLTWCFLLFI